MVHCNTIITIISSSYLLQLLWQGNKKVRGASALVHTTHFVLTAFAYPKPRVHNFITLICQIETPGVLLGLVVAYPPWFYDSDDFFYFWTLWVLSGLWFFKSAWWCFYKEDFPLLPLWFFRYHSSTSSPSGFYSACGFQKVTGEVFRSPPMGFIWPVVFTALPMTF